MVRPAIDEFDFFDVELRAGQQIILQFPDPSVADLDLYLLNHEGQIIDGSIGPGDSTHPGESTWHGTHVAGIAAAESNNAIGVAAINQLAPYSGFGDRLDLVAPGGNMRVDHTGDGYPDGIMSTLVDDTSGTRRSAYAFYQGTSMATAVVSGVVSLARSIDPGLTPDTFAFLLESGRLTDDMVPRRTGDQR